MATQLQLESSINRLNENVYKVNILDVSKNFLPDRDILKNILKQRMPNSSEDEIDIIVGKYKDIKEDDKARKSKSKSVRDKSRRKKADYEPTHPIPDSNPILKDEIRKLKREVRYSCMMLVKYSSDMAIEVVNVTTMMVSSIAGVTIMAAAPPWNIPGAITLLTNVINTIVAAINKVAEALKYLFPLEQLALVIQPNALTPIRAILKGAVDAINSFFEILKQASKFISKLIDLLKSLTGKVFNLGRTNRFIRKNDEEEIQSQDIPTGQQFKVLLDEANKQAATINSLALKAASKVTTEIATVYDVELPDGTRRFNLTEEELEEIKGLYDIIFKEEESRADGYEEPIPTFNIDFEGKFPYLTPTLVLTTDNSSIMSSANFEAVVSGEVFTPSSALIDSLMNTGILSAVTTTTPTFTTNPSNNSNVFFNRTGGGGNRGGSSLNRPQGPRFTQ